MRIIPYHMRWGLQLWWTRRRVYHIEPRFRLLRWLSLAVLAAIALPTLLSVAAVFAVRYIDPPVSSVMLHRWKESAHADAALRYRWVDLEEISPWVAIAVVAAEDQKFPEHAGFDTESIIDALRDHARGRRTRGASTISQQVAKNVFLWPEKSLLRKGLEAWLTVCIELLWPKERILEVYLNVAEFGRGVFGVAAASEIFFHTAPSGLRPRQAALLAAVLPNPSQLRADRPSPYVLARRDWILGQMRMLGGPAYLDL